MPVKLRGRTRRILRIKKRGSLPFGLAENEKENKEDKKETGTAKNAHLQDSRIPLPVYLQPMTGS